MGVTWIIKKKVLSWIITASIGLVFGRVFELSAQTKPIVVKRPIQWDADRERLSLEYLLKRHGIRADTALIEPRIVVVHYTENMSVNATFKTFNPVFLPGRRDLQTASSLNVSAQFIIGRDGRIYQLLEENQFARHTIGLNYCAIGIENIGTPRNPLTEKQLQANTKLIKYLREKYAIEYVIGHHEYQAFKKTLWWKETNPTYMTSKRDPGDKFMHALRKELGLPATLKIAPLPSQ
ncbi:N-acetylmuramoyl-L-alanine amidase [Sphingobacterium faecale]|uniref:N-acetylmuramoyl-L-alanine amidase n=1 Tax=Sphingobacterium faecale TaxID=2803775 RepID=A0ABS1R8S6_9SPHI|nr:peptidoglycan recognition family protein [Sphingobacterium faecale]MBL1410216.1 N-acetylmuramoyl-L-alanine amidase [Sphingobacterium faecale]